MSAVLNTERLSVGKKTDISDAYSAPANFLEIEGKLTDGYCIKHYILFSLRASNTWLRS